MAAKGRRVGEAYIEVRPETRGFEGDVRRTATRTARRVRVDVPVDADARGLRRQVTAAARRAGAGQRVTVEVDADTRRAERSISRFRRGIRGLNSEVNDARQASEGLQFPGMAAAALLAASGVQALTGASVGLVAALSPMVGLAGALPGMLASLGQAGGTAALAFSGIGDAVSALAEQQTASAEEAEAAAEKVNEAMAGLSPTAQRFARFIAGLRDELTGLRQTAQRTLLPGVQQGLTDALRLLPAVDRAVDSTGRTLGRAARRFGEFLGSGPFRRDFATIAHGNTRLLGDFGAAGLDVARALTDITVTAQPLTRWLGQLARDGAAAFASFTSGQRASGGLARFFDQARQSARQFGAIVRNLAGTIGNVFAPALPHGTALLATLERLTARLREVTGSVEGQEALARFFATSAEIGRQLGPVLADVAVRFGQIFAAVAEVSNAFLGLLDANPILRELATTAIAASLALRALTIISPIGRALAFYRVVVTGVVNAKRAYVAVTNSAVAATVRERAAALGSAAAARAQAVASAVFNRAALFNVQMLAGLTLAQIRYRAATIASTVATRAGAVAARAAAVAQAALNVVLSLNPIGLVVAALVALGAAFVLAYRRSETFRRIVNGVWNWLRSTAASIGRWVADRLTAAWNAVVAGARRMAAGIRAAVAPIRNIISGISRGIRSVGRGIRSVIPGFQRGGRVPGQGRGDRVPALLEPGEVVVPNRARDVRQLARDPSIRTRLATAVASAATGAASAPSRSAAGAGGVARFQSGGIVGTGRLAVAASGRADADSQTARMIVAAVRAGVQSAMGGSGGELRLVVTDKAGRALFEAVERERGRRQRSLGAVAG